MRRDHAPWLMAPSFIRGILSLEEDKRFAVTFFQESCGLCKWHRDHHRGFGNLSASCHHDTAACTLKRERYKEGCMHELLVERVAGTTDQRQPTSAPPHDDGSSGLQDGNGELASYRDRRCDERVPDEGHAGRKQGGCDTATEGDSSPAVQLREEAIDEEKEAEEVRDNLLQEAAGIASDDDDDDEERKEGCAGRSLGFTFRARHFLHSLTTLRIGCGGNVSERKWSRKYST